MAADEAIDDVTGGEVQLDAFQAESTETDSAAYCRTMADFYNPVPRFWIRELFQEFLDGRHLTPTELLHLPHLQRELAGYNLRLTLLQRAASAQTHAKGPMAKKRFEELVALEEEVVRFTTQRGRRGEPPGLDPRTFAAAVKKLYGANPGFEGRFDIDALLAHHLVGLKTYAAKTDRLIALIEGEAPAEAFTVVDQVLGEILASPAANLELFGWLRDYRALLEMLADLWSGETIDLPGMTPLARRLNKLLSEWDMTICRRGIEVSIHRLLMRDDRLAPVSDVDLLGTSGIIEELIATGTVAARLKKQGTFIGGKKTAKLIDRRVSRLLSEEKLEDMLRGKSFYAKLIDLFELDQAVIGEYSQKIVTG
ncbi:MAG TPA: hypothetical protein VEB64_00670, partial [Azospirillaceae bacterium]|nr:hypothetical protein [Azospirillaceae bacterium]